MDKSILSEVNSAKSKNGGNFEKSFTEKTGIKKLLKKDKPRFTNEHGVEQIVDFDFLWVDGDTNHWLDLTTSYRSDRAKQKAYNGLMVKKNDPNCKVWMVAGSFLHKERVIKPTILEGLDETISIEVVLKRIMGKNE